ncbi:Predicted PurR-regulated permease PerM [Noviherbaspirillum humi]|uniref:Predicted PurR-regulated permease PerM n=1 Tax=Noviherbaspirillum humi TaxID=1688639 RepID=A0A239JML2_9BURK|nr:AI-2E family transporter [Noviherbaspirillum humi]SNT07087.1 Predicted PurR-regulated permease PerM [Noviherbaspirillum humi]
MRRLKVELSLTSMVAMVLVLAAVWLMIKLLPALLLLVAALFLAGALSPVVEWLEGRGLRRHVAIGLVFGGLLLVAAAGLATTLPEFFDQARGLIDQEPAIRKKLIDFLSAYPMTASLADELHNLRYEELLRGSGKNLFALSLRIVEISVYAIAAIFLALYVMLDRDRLRGALFAIVPRERHVRLAHILLKLQTIVGGYIRGQIATCILMGVFMFVLLRLCGVPNALALSVFGALADLLPLVGIFLTMGPAVLAALAVSTTIGIVVFVLMLIYEEVESRVLIPLVYGRALRLPSSVVLFALFAGATLYGVVGALLALPVAATVLMLVDELQVELPGEAKAPEDLRAERETEQAEREYQRRTTSMPAKQAAGVAVRISEQREESSPPAGEK